jgi:hypothetical protein
MSTFHSHQERFRDRATEGRFVAASLARMTATGLHRLLRRAARRGGAIFAIVYRGIVTAKTRRLQRELLFHGGARDGASVEPLQDSRGLDRDAAKFAQRPLLLGDKWDF